MRARAPRVRPRTPGTSLHPWRLHALYEQLCTPRALRSLLGQLAVCLFRDVDERQNKLTGA